MNKEKKNLLVFGYGLPVIIAFFLWRHAVKSGHFGFWPWVFVGIGCVFAVVTAVDYRKLKPVYAKWMVAAHFIGGIISTLVLAILFYFVFGIVGIVLRLLRKDNLHRKLEPEKPSYWIKREQKEFDKDSYTKQF